MPAGTRIRHRAAPNPYSCRWCGTDRHHHGSSYVRSQGMHFWVEPTTAQILARMRARRERRLTVEPVYHAATRLVAYSDGEEGVPLCADCLATGCAPWLRVQWRLDRIRWGLTPPTRSKPGRWGAEPW
ncbi:hypothetical protein PV334_19880 [Streptomyces sp. ME02-7008A-1]|uniref:hypothetical protein n=1 Tax=unclassified Streptomyces TaxID=2593676 RepID=UPI0029B9A2D8|nr:MULTISPECIES: hypothetical protein [unclassified Streptomyces]MDX3183508.1 hypothetical protein [Streptomyces sp. ME02-7008A-1]MDX3303960.1 hypothetical protein [Streptomyces sp. ME02-7008A]